jgi:transcriptional regulator with XRE-family HTH domain
MEHDMIERVIEFMKSRGLNPSSLSRGIGMPQKTVNNYLSGRRKLSLEFIAKLGGSFGLNLDWLITGNGSAEVVVAEARESEDGKYETKYHALLEENRELSQENRKLYQKHTLALEKTIALQEKILVLSDDLSGNKEELAEGASDVITVLTSAGS